MPKPACDEPTKALAIDGEVTLIGPQGVGLSLTPAAATESGRRLIRAADEARDQVPPVRPPGQGRTPGASRPRRQIP